MRTVVLDDELAALLEQDKPLEQAARETLVMDLFRRGRITTGRACSLLGLDRAALARRAAELDIAYFQVTKDDWEVEKATLAAWPSPSPWPLRAGASSSTTCKRGAWR